MKRVGYLMERVYDFSHLYRSYRKALKGSGKTRESMAFTFALESELLALSHSLKEGIYQPAPYRYFTIYDPKEREIAVAQFRDRVVHHAVVSVLEPIYECVFVYDSYATRKGKGVHVARARAQYFLKRYDWYGKADIHQYFASVDHKVLLGLLARKVKDRAFLGLVERILTNGGEHGKGLPVGNLTSQFFANVYLNPFDHYVKEVLKVKGYVRYMDDFVWLAYGKKRIKEVLKHVEHYLRQELLLVLKPTATLINRRLHGLPFLGARIFPSLMRIRRENLRRLLQRLHRKEWEFRQGKLSEDQFIASMNSYYAYWDSFDSYRLRQRLRH